MKILVLSSVAWDNSNSHGSTFSNFFEGMEDVELANIYCQNEKPHNDLEMRYFQMTERSLIKNLLNRNYPTGREITAEKGEGSADSMTAGERKLMTGAKKIRLRVFYWARELLWRIGRVKSPELKEFIKSFDPDVLFMGMSSTMYITRLARWLIGFTGAPCVLFVGDDLYSLKRIDASPLFWIDRFIKRAGYRKLVKKADKLLMMTEMGKKEYDRAFGTECGILTKSLDFSSETMPTYEKKEGPMRFVYTGNLYDGRWRSLAKLGRALQKLNDAGNDTELLIYSMSPLTKRMREAFIIPAVRFMGGVPSEMIPGIQSGADVLVHAESPRLREKLRVRLSFSTKLVDYMHAGRCILAIGSNGLASIDHLRINDAAVIADGADEMFSAVKRLAENRELVSEYAAKAWRCGLENHDKSVVQARLRGLLEEALREKRART